MGAESNKQEDFFLSSKGFSKRMLSKESEGSSEVTGSVLAKLQICMVFTLNNSFRNTVDPHYVQILYL